MKVSSFISEESYDLFEKIEPLKSSGSTSQSFLVSRKGEQFFMKQLRPEHIDNPRYNLILKKEYEIGHCIDHPNIVRYKELGLNGDGPYILMEYVTGETLAEKLENEPSYFRNDDNLSKFFNQLLDALECMHRHNIVYCDLKPENVMLTRINNDVKIIDLGFCDTDDYTFTAGMTKAFSAPEQLARKRKELDARTDIYTVGKLMEYIEQKSGRRLPLSYRLAMKRSLKEDKAKRFDSAKAMAKAINKSYKKLWIALSCIAVLVAASIGWQMFKNSENYKYLMLYLEKDATIEGVHYKVISEEDASCMAIGRERHVKKDTRSGETNIYIKEEIQIDGKAYSVTEIADSAFNKYDDFVSVNLPNSLRRIGKSAFEASQGLVSVNIPEGITETEAKCFYRSGIRSVKLPTTLKTIKHASFAICKSLKSVDIPEGVETLGLDAFAECLELQSVILPSTLRTISRGVFWKCKSLKEITIPASVETIGEYAFFHCDSLKHVYNYSTEPQPLSVIFNRKDITIHVPAASVEKYRKAQHWRDMNIVAMNDER